VIVEMTERLLDLWCMAAACQSYCCIYIFLWGSEKKGNITSTAKVKEEERQGGERGWMEGRVIVMANSNCIVHT